MSRTSQDPSLPLDFFEVPSPPVSGFCAEVAVPLPLENSYTYAVPDTLKEFLQPGCRVWVPFRNREIVAYLVRLRPRSAQDQKLKSILKVLDPEPVLSSFMLDLTLWIADYYACSWGEAIENALPRWVKFGKKADRVKPAKKFFQEEVLEDKTGLTLTAEQQCIFDVLRQEILAPSKPYLIHGVTGSGKSEIYIRMIKEALDQKKSSICLVPEIALTEQIRRFFYLHFGEHLEILHSKLSDSERFHAWKRIERGEKQVVLGPRSAIFAPVKNLGLIVMDEEHEGTYKQETVPRYHAREVARRRALHEKALFVMGTATPSLESMHEAKTGEITLLELRERVDRKAMPSVRILDLKRISQDRKRSIILSPTLITEVEKNLNDKAGTILLLNRRGFSTHIHCPKCGHIETCPSCQISLTYHQEDDALLCHYCNYKRKIAEECSQCGAPNLKFMGFGTEKIESEVAARFPMARVARMDADSVQKKGSHEIILKEFREQKIDILIGTQMIAKGFDFPHVTLVGVVLADVGLMLPDFRSAERTFQLLTQVAGRAGRGQTPGRVLIQTFSPEHPSVTFAQHHDFAGFYGYETPVRQEFHYPPFYRLVNIIVRSKTENKAYAAAREIRDLLRQDLFSPAVSGNTAFQPSADTEIEIMGPAQLPFYKLRGHYRWHVMLKMKPGKNWVPEIKKSLSRFKKTSEVLYAIDVDPLSVL